jgi:hypothetical protein
MDIMYQALGLTPDNKAEYSEQKRVYDARRGDLVREASSYRKNIAVAIERGDMEAARDQIAKAIQFDQKNPAYAVVPGMAGTLRQRELARQMAVQRGLPIGVPTKDLEAQGLTRFADY